MRNHPFDMIHALGSDNDRPFSAKVSRNMADYDGGGLNLCPPRNGYFRPPGTRRKYLISGWTLTCFTAYFNLTKAQTEKIKNNIKRVNVRLLESEHANGYRLFISDFGETMYLSPIEISNRVPAGQLLQKCWETLAEDSVPIPIGPDYGFVITHQQSLVEAFAGSMERRFGLGALSGGQGSQGNSPFGYSNRKGGH